MLINSEISPAPSQQLIVTLLSEHIVQSYELFSDYAPHHDIVDLLDLHLIHALLDYLFGGVFRESIQQRVDKRLPADQSPITINACPTILVRDNQSLVLLDEHHEPYIYKILPVLIFFSADRTLPGTDGVIELVIFIVGIAIRGAVGGPNRDGDNFSLVAVEVGDRVTVSTLLGREGSYLEDQVLFAFGTRQIRLPHWFLCWMILFIIPNSGDKQIY